MFWLLVFVCDVSSMVCHISMQGVCSMSCCIKCKVCVSVLLVQLWFAMCCILCHLQWWNWSQLCSSVMFIKICEPVYCISVTAITPVWWSLFRCAGVTRLLSATSCSQYDPCQDSPCRANERWVWTPLLPLGLPSFSRVPMGLKSLQKMNGHFQGPDGFKVCGNY